MSVSIDNISKTFVSEKRSVHAIRNVSLNIHKGEFFSLLGPSGCGKTTTIRCLAGLENPDSGEIKLGDEIVFSRSRNRIVPSNRRKIGMVFQSYAVWPHMTVFDNVAFPLKHGSKKRLSSSEIQERVAKVLALVHLEDFAKRSSTQLSGGQQQRVALARSLVKNPDVVLLDEPLSNLDAKLRIETRLELRLLLKKAGATAVYVTHDQAEAFAVSDRIGVMVDGRLIQVGTPREIYLQPSEHFIADFVGRINFLDGEVIEGAELNNQKAVKTSIGILECQGLDQLQIGQKIIIGIRSESIALCQPNEMGAQNIFNATVKTAVFLGEYLDCELMIGDQMFTAKVPPECVVNPGDHLQVQLPCSKWVVMP